MKNKSAYVLFCSVRSLTGEKRNFKHCVMLRKGVKWNETVATWTPTIDTVFNIVTRGSSITRV